MCWRNKAKWQELSQSTDRKKAGVVNGHQVNNAFVKPFTRGTGCSVALLYNNGEPIDADVMISHTWNEDMDQVEEAINDMSQRDGRGDDLAIWFCIFGNYQCGDEPGDMGPTVQQQLEKDPFGTVIRSDRLSFMCLSITSEEDPYQRLWCVYELNVALDVQEDLLSKGDPRASSFILVELSVAAATAYAKRMREWASEQAQKAQLDVAEWMKQQPQGPEHAYYMAVQDCSKAECSRDEDAQFITAEILAKIGWEKLNRRMADFRRPPVKPERETSQTDLVLWRSLPSVVTWSGGVGAVSRRRLEMGVGEDMAGVDEAIEIGWRQD